MVSFNEVPDDTRVPLFHVEFDGSLAGRQDVFAPSLLIGQMLDTGSVPADTPVRVSTVEDAKSLFGQGSMLAIMMAAFRASNSVGEVWALPLADNGAGAKATGEIAVTGTATATGTLNLYIDGVRVQVAVATGDTATEVATATAAVINAAKDLPVTAASNVGDVTLTARHAGELGNVIDLRLNHFGALGGESTPTGIAVAFTAMGGAGMTVGTSNPSMTAGLANLGDEPFDYIAMPYSDATSLNTIDTAMGAATGRWAWNRQVFGHVFNAKRGTLAELGTFGNGRNGRHICTLGSESTDPASVVAKAAAFTAQMARALTNDPARPVMTLKLNGLLAPKEADRFTAAERNTLLYDGIATSSVDAAGVVQLERAVTHYQTNDFGDPDTAWLDVQTPATLTVFTREMRGMIQTTFPRMKLVADAARLNAGQAAVSPRQIKGAIIAKYAELERRGLVENTEAFATSLIVEKSATDPNRVNVLAKPDLVNQLNVVAMRTQFLLDTPLAA
ncbi:phage tail sheath subtilisin-like domain-containing protein [Pyruvatibacter sp.]